MTRIRKFLTDPTLRVCYVKLGYNNQYASYCFESELVVFGLWSGESRMWKACIDNKWKTVKKALLRMRHKHLGRYNERDVPHEMRQLKYFFTVPQAPTLWLNCRDGFLYWAISGPAEPYPVSEGPSDFLPIKFGDDEMCRRTVEVRWSYKDLRRRKIAIPENFAILAYNVALIQPIRNSAALIELIKGPPTKSSKK